MFVFESCKNNVQSSFLFDQCLLLNCHYFLRLLYHIHRESSAYNYICTCARIFYEKWPYFLTILIKHIPIGSVNKKGNAHMLYMTTYQEQNGDICFMIGLKACHPIHIKLIYNYHSPTIVDWCFTLCPTGQQHWFIEFCSLRIMIHNYFCRPKFACLRLLHKQ